MYRWESLIGPILGTHTFGSQTPLPPPPLQMLAWLPPNDRTAASGGGGGGGGGGLPSVGRSTRAALCRALHCKPYTMGR